MIIRTPEYEFKHALFVVQVGHRYLGPCWRVEYEATAHIARSGVLASGKYSPDADAGAGARELPRRHIVDRNGNMIDQSAISFHVSRAPLLQTQQQKQEREHKPKQEQRPSFLTQATSPTAATVVGPVTVPMVRYGCFKQGRYCRNENFKLKFMHL